ncbi:MAG: hypothetical protein MAG453_00459 [Calditrichaeota bacterium]|nr:hypothetical protein [Calditrichota bacterium]
MRALPVTAIIFCVALAAGAQDLNFTLVGSLDTPGWANQVAVAGDCASVADRYAYVADGNSGLRVIYVGIPDTPWEAGFCDTPGFAFGISAADGYAYVSDRDSGLRVIDVSDPTAPAEVSSCNTPGSAEGVAVVREYAYVADGYAGLQVLTWQLELTLTLTPIAGTIVPQQGGQVVYDAEIWTSWPYGLFGGAWTAVDAPNGNTYELMQTFINLPPGPATYTWSGLTQNVPGWAPAGLYTFHGYLGNHNTGTVVAEDSFEFFKTVSTQSDGGGPGDAPWRGTAAGWDAAGWEQLADGWPGARPGFHTPSDQPRGRARTGGTRMRDSFQESLCWIDSLRLTSRYVSS